MQVYGLVHVTDVHVQGLVNIRCRIKVTVGMFAPATDQTNESGLSLSMSART